MKFVVGLAARARMPSVMARRVFFTMSAVVACALVLGLLTRIDPTYHGARADYGDTRLDGEADDADGPHDDGTAHEEHHAPVWITVPRTLSHTRDNVPVTFRVSVDVQSRRARSWLGADKLPLHLQGAVSAMTRAEIAGPDGHAALAERMLQTVRDRIEASGEDPEEAVHCLAIEELLVSAR